MIENIILVSLGIITSVILFLCYVIFDIYRTYKQVEELYYKFSVGDHVARKVDGEFRASWAVVIKKQVNSILVQYESGQVIDIPFDLNHIDEIKLWYKSKE